MEVKVTTLYNTLKEVGEKALGIGKVNMVEMLNQHPAEYLVNAYDKLYLQDYPPHLNREHLVTSQTKISIEALNQIKFQLDAVIEKMGEYAPTLKEDVKSNIKKSDFNIYLDESKREYYEALNKLIEDINGLRKYNAVGQTVNIIRAFPDLIMEGLNVKINTSKFI
jgi:DNA repair ATPase RecN